MAALIFRRAVNAQEPLPYSTWLSDFDGPIVLFTITQEAEDKRFAHVEYFDSFDDNGQTEARALELFARFPYKYIFAQSEHDILRAAQLREYLHIAGQSCDSARAFRDKFYMKNLAKAAGVNVAPFAVLNTPGDLYNFVADHGYACVIKPRMGAGARGVHVLHSENDLEDFLKGPFPSNNLVEVFINAPVFHVDGLVGDKHLLFACSSKYINNCLSHQSGESYGSALMDPNRPLSRRLVSTVETILHLFPIPSHFAFHAEFFVESSDRTLLCEIASRPGGSGIVEMIERGYRINLYEQWLRRALDLPINLPPAQPWLPTGRVWIPPCRGRLLSLPVSIPFEWVVNYRPNSVLGQTWRDPSFCTDNIASFTISGGNTEEVESRFHLLDQWFRNQVAWEID